jgi:hypothetical protein
MPGADLVRTTYTDLRDLLAAVDETDSWSPTGARGWCVRDLTYHCTMDAQRALVALHSPTTRRPERDAVSYWRGWGADPVGAANGRRWTRVSASMFLDWDQLRGLHAETAAAVVHASLTDPTTVVETQGHALLVDDLLRTLAVEAAIHHLDVVAHLPELRGPSEPGLGEARRVLDGLAGTPFPAEWDDVRVVLLGTGRATPDAKEILRLGPVAHQLPLFS